MTARPTATLFVLLAIGACAPRLPGIPEHQVLTEVQSECLTEARREANRNRAIARQMNAEVPANNLRTDRERQEAEDTALRECLRRRGSPMPGGVERVQRRPEFVFSWW